MTQPRKDIRTKILQQRLALSRNEIADASQQACSRIALSDFWQSSQHIAFYIAQKGEMDPISLQDLAMQQGKTCYLPSLAGAEFNELVMVQYQSHDPLTPNRFNIPEPAQDPAKIIDPSKLDLVLVPLVAYDVYGSRLGMGLGYYDRTFAFLNQAERPKRPLLVGLAYRFQQQERLPRASWDVPLDWIATEFDLMKILNFSA